MKAEISTSINLEQFKKKIRARNPFSANRTTDACDWYFKDTELFHERSHWSTPRKPSRYEITPAMAWRMTKQTTYEYWPMVIYADKKEAKIAATNYGGEVIECFYSDAENPMWFVVFKDLEKVIEYVYDYLVKNKPELLEN